MVLFYGSYFLFVGLQQYNLLKFEVWVNKNDDCLDMWRPIRQAYKLKHSLMYVLVQEYGIFRKRLLQHLEPGPRLNIKTVLSTYGDFHVKDKTAVRTSYL